MKHVEAAARDFIGIFDRLQRPYALMGGLAVRAFGVPRPTYDVDIILAVADEELPALYVAVEAAGYTVPEAYRNGWVDRVADMPLVKFRIYRGTPGESVDVDLFLVRTEFQRQLIDRRVRIEVHDIGHTRVVSPEDLVLLKLIAGRPRDMGDIDDVRFMQGALDAAYMRDWARRLGVADPLERLLAKPPV
jgi:hypothetical protein